MSGPQPEGEVVDFLYHDHEVIRHLVSDFPESSSDRRRWVEELVPTLVRHEVAEQQVVYPAIRSDTLPGDVVAAALIEEESEVEQLLAKVEWLDPKAGSLARTASDVQSQVLQHLRDEEVNLFPILSNLEADVRRWELGDRYLRAVRAAPVHAHPRVPVSGPARVITAPFVGAVDRIRQAVYDELS